MANKKATKSVSKGTAKTTKKATPKKAMVKNATKTITPVAKKAKKPMKPTKKGTKCEYTSVERNIRTMPNGKYQVRVYNNGKYLSGTTASLTDARSMRTKFSA
jgi:hypothetical protein